MTVALKAYQRRALEAWKSFLDRCAAGMETDAAFSATTGEAWGHAIPYLPAPCLGRAPAVCLRIPTGGGKTLVAAAACGLAAASGAWARGGRQVVVWLVPTTTIAEQTLLTLRQARHPCRLALVEGISGFPGLGPIRVMEAAEALALPAADVRSGAVIVVSTIQSFRVENTDQRAVYRQNGQLMDHGLLDPSLAKVLALYHPFIIVDEAHNARTDASFDALGRLDPALVLEITATPTRQGSARLPSNVLYSASAHELHAEHMLKLPLELAVNPDPDQCLSLAVRRRADLQRLTEADVAAGAPYLRPLLLIQAQAKKAGTDTLTPDVVKAKLVADHEVEATAIRIATGSVRELDDIDREYPHGLQDPLCPVTTIITVEALREGWDCPAAYVLCTLKGSFTDTAAVQIVGRILRQPGAALRREPALNRAYAVAAASRFGETLAQLRDVLVTSLGYEKEYADQVAVGMAPSVQPGVPFPLPEPVAVPPGTMLIAPRLAALSDSIQGKIQADVQTGTLVVKAWLAEDERQQVTACIDDGPVAVAFNHALRTAFDRVADAAQGAAVAVAVCPAERGVPFTVPQILVCRQERWEEVTDTLLTRQDWTLDEPSAILDEKVYVPRSPRFDQAEVEVDYSGHVVSRLRESEDAACIMVPGTSASRVVGWLSLHVKAEDVPYDDLQRWLLTAVHHLTRNRGIDPGILETDQCNLKRVLEARLDEMRSAVRRQEVQECLFAAEARQGLRSSPRDRHFSFDPTTYPVGEIEREVRFRKHYYRVVGAFDSMEERDCAVALDNLNEVATWVRNLVRREPHSFRLPRRPGPGGRWFYPDFVGMLSDGRTMVLEYKGADRLDSQETVDKREAGELWARVTGGLFVLVGDGDYDAIRRHLASHPVPSGVHPSWPPGFWDEVRREGPRHDLATVPPMAFPLAAPDPAEWEERR